jgi:hypothetical protein
MKLKLIHHALLVILALTAFGGLAGAQTFSSEDLASRTVERRAVEAAI